MLNSFFLIFLALFVFFVLAVFAKAGSWVLSGLCWINVAEISSPFVLISSLFVFLFSLFLRVHCFRCWIVVLLMFRLVLSWNRYCSCIFVECNCVVQMLLIAESKSRVRIDCWIRCEFKSCFTEFALFLFGSFVIVCTAELNRLLPPSSVFRVDWRFRFDVVSCQWLVISVWNVAVLVCFDFNWLLFVYYDLAFAKFLVL